MVAVVANTIKIKQFIRKFLF